MNRFFSEKLRLGRVAWALVDQATFALGNFLLNILLARLLSPQNYGIFALVFVVYTFVFTLYGSLITEPMLVFANSKFANNFSLYLRSLFRMHWQLTLSIMLGLFFIGLIGQFCGWHLVAQACIGLGIVIPTGLLSVLMRRATYPQNRQYLAGLGGILYLFLVVSSIFMVDHFWTLNSTIAFIIMGCSGLLTGLSIYPMLNHQNSTTVFSVNISIQSVWKQHWSYGVWSVPASLMAWLPWNFPVLILPLWYGIETTATLKALLNVISPIMNVVVLNNTLILPILARARGTGIDQFKKRIWVFIRLVLAATIINWLAVGLLHRLLVGWLYNGQYLLQSQLLWFLALLPLLDGVIIILASALRALEQPREIFIAYLIAAIVLLTMGTVLVAQLGLVGTIASIAMTLLTVLIVLAKKLIQDQS